MTNAHYTTDQRQPDSLPEQVPGEVVQVALNALLGSMKGKQLAAALAVLDAAIMCRVPSAVSPASPNVVRIRAKVDAGYIAAARQQLGREAEQLSTIALQLRQRIARKGARK